MAGRLNFAFLILFVRWGMSQKSLFIVIPGDEIVWKVPNYVIPADAGIHKHACRKDFRLLLPPKNTIF
jgi:hypothetical protein